MKKCAWDQILEPLQGAQVPEVGFQPPSPPSLLHSDFENVFLRIVGRIKQNKGLATQSSLVCEMNKHHCLLGFTAC